MRLLLPLVALLPTAAIAQAPPKDAVVLFDGNSTDEWVSVGDGSPAAWPVVDGALTVRAGSGNIQTRRRFGSYRLHLEWRTPAPVAGEGQGRGNSGLFLASTGPGDDGYELQILDSWHNPTYADGAAGSLYKQAAPRTNAARPPGVWQTYDVTWIAPRFDAAGEVTRPARVTVRWNGVLVHDRVALAGPTLFQGRPAYRPHGRAPIKLQDHGQPVAFRNIWLRELP